VQGVAEKIEAGRAEAEQARDQEAEDRRAQARQEREQAEQERELEEAQQEAARRTRETARQVAEVAMQPASVATDMARQMTRLAAGASEAAMPSRGSTTSLTSLFFAPWMGMMQGMQQQPSRALSPRQDTRQATGAEEVIGLGEEVLEIGKRTEARGTARIRRYVVETPVEREVTLVSERVVVERRRPQRDARTGEVLTEVTVEVIETAEVPVVEKHLRLREEIVIRTERSERVETVRETLKRDEVEVQQPGGRARRQAQRAN
jgi:hypothetical protein